MKRSQSKKKKYCLECHYKLRLIACSPSIRGETCEYTIPVEYGCCINCGIPTEKYQLRCPNNIGCRNKLSKFKKNALVCDKLKDTYRDFYEVKSNYVDKLVFKKMKSQINYYEFKHYTEGSLNTCWVNNIFNVCFLHTYLKKVVPNMPYNNCNMWKNRPKDDISINDVQTVIFVNDRIKEKVQLNVHILSSKKYRLQPVGIKVRNKVRCGEYMNYEWYLGYPFKNIPFDLKYITIKDIGKMELIKKTNYWPTTKIISYGWRQISCSAIPISLLLGWRDVESLFSVFPKEILQIIIHLLQSKCFPRKEVITYLGYLDMTEKSISRSRSRSTY
jgi:hypothetical protein